MSTEPLTPEQIEELKKRHIRSFCMRRGHISNAQEKALEELLPLYEIPYDANQMFDAVKTFRKQQSAGPGNRLRHGRNHCCDCTGSS